MARVVFGKHAAVRAPRAERDKIRTCYRDVLSCTLVRDFDDKDDFRMGDGFYRAFLYESGRGVAVDEGVTYAAADALSADDFLKAIPRARARSVVRRKSTYNRLTTQKRPSSFAKRTGRRGAGSPPPSFGIRASVWPRALPLRERDDARTPIPGPRPSDA